MLAITIWSPRKCLLGARGIAASIKGWSVWVCYSDKRMEGTRYLMASNFSTEDCILIYYLSGALLDRPLLPCRGPQLEQNNYEHMNDKGEAEKSCHAARKRPHF